MKQVPEKAGAGEGNRTLVFSLEGCCSTIELHPRQGLPNTAGRRSQLPRGRLSQAFRPSRRGWFRNLRRPLNSSGLPAYIEVSRNQRKEVIQCLLPSAVTSLGSPAKSWIGLGIGALSALDQRARNRARRGLPAAPFLWSGHFRGTLRPSQSAPSPPSTSRIFRDRSAFRYGLRSSATPGSSWPSWTIVLSV